MQISSDLDLRIVTYNLLVSLSLILWILYRINAETSYVKTLFSCFLIGSSINSPHSILDALK